MNVVASGNLSMLSHPGMRPGRRHMTLSPETDLQWKLLSLKSGHISGVIRLKSTSEKV
jgi:hypothetical protein